jgi:hypothetical protein
MNNGELLELVPQLFGQHLEGARPQIIAPILDGSGAWWFRPDEALAIISVMQQSEIRITLGLAIDVPYSAQTSHYLNGLNQTELVYGRLFLVGNEESSKGAVLMQEIVQGDSLSWDYPASLQNFLRIGATMVGQADRISKSLGLEVGGRRLNDDEHMFVWMHQ